MCRPTSPVHSMRPARDTCEQCHWAERFHGDETRTMREYAEDEQNTETDAADALRGGGSTTRGVGTSIHWHMNLANEIDYVTKMPNERRSPTFDCGIGAERSGSMSWTVQHEQLATAERRRLDCMDCHNRPAHTFEFTPERGRQGDRRGPDSAQAAVRAAVRRWQRSPRSTQPPNWAGCFATAGRLSIAAAEGSRPGRAGNRRFTGRLGPQCFSRHEREAVYLPESRWSYRHSRLLPLPR